MPNCMKDEKMRLDKALRNWKNNQKEEGKINASYKIHIERDQKVGYILMPYITHDNKQRPIQWTKGHAIKWDKDYAEGRESEG